jgi:glycerol-3-phosphate O-acyltransferase
LTNDKTSSKEIKLHLTTIKNTLKKLGYFDEDTIDVIFGSSRHSYRYLRNAVVHKISRKAINSIELNHNQQIEKMNSFIEHVKKLF